MTNFRSTLERELNQIKIYTELSAKLDEVWKYYSEYQYLKKWIAPEGCELTTESMLFEPGGSWFYRTTDPEGNKRWYKSEYLDIDPLHSITIMDSVCDENGTILREYPVTKWTTTFQDEDGLNIVVYSTIDFESREDLNTYIDSGEPDRVRMAHQRLDAHLVKA